MLNLTDPDLFPIAYADWDLPSDFLETTSTNNKKKVKISLPPPGVAIKKSNVNGSNRSKYFSSLSNGKMTDYSAVNNLLDELRKYLSIEPIPEYVIKKSHLGPKITEELTRLPIYIANGYDDSDHSLIAIEIKGPSAKRLDLENLFFQGLQHRDWLEQNKMAIKLIFDGPRGKNINTRKRVRLIIGFFGKEIPSLFFELRDKKQRKDQHIQISFVEFSCDDDKLRLKHF